MKKRKASCLLFTDLSIKSCFTAEMCGVIELVKLWMREMTGGEGRKRRRANQIQTVKGAVQCGCPQY